MKQKRFLCTILGISLCNTSLFSERITPFDPSYVSLVASERNYLFRGSIPQNEEGEFILERLVSTLKNAAREKSTTLPEQFTLTIISLLTEERAEETRFMKRFNGKRKRGRFLVQDEYTWGWWQVRPHIHSIPKGCMQFKQAFDGEYLRFPQLIKTIEKLYDSRATLPKVIYVHCRHGRNRTTAAIGGFLMKKYALTLHEVWQKIVVPGIYDPKELYYFLTSYAQYLRSLSRTSPQNTHQ